MKADSTQAAVPISTTLVGQLRVEVYRDRAEVGKGSALRVLDTLRAELKVHDHVRMILAAAPSQAEMMANLIRSDDIDWGRVTLFHMDEYIGLDAQAEASFGNWLSRHIFCKVPAATVHKIVPGDDPESEAVRYSALLDEAPINIVCLGIGVNGHIAFNDPPVADFNDPRDVKAVELDDLCRQQQVDDGGFAALADVPTHALTLTIPRVLKADHLFCIAPGKNKADAVGRCLSGEISARNPASVLRSKDNCILFLDRESAANV